MYKVIEAEGLKDFNDQLTEENKNGWTPYYQVFVYYQNGQTYFCQQLYKSK